MKIVCSINMNGKMFDKLVEIGFVRIPNIQDFHYPSSHLEDFEQGLINELVVHRKNGCDIDYYKDNFETRLLNVGITDIDIDVWDKLVAVGAITSPQYRFYQYKENENQDEINRYYLSGYFLNVISVVSQSYDDPRPEFCINCSHGISDIKNHPCQWLERDEESCNKKHYHED